MSETLVVVDPAILGDEPDAEMGAWLRPDGAPVEGGEVIAEINAAKATVEVAAPVAGTLRHLVEAGALLTAGTPIAAIAH